MRYLITTHGPLDASQPDSFCPMSISSSIYARSNRLFCPGRIEDVVRLMAPELARARNSGITALVECTPEGVGRRADLVWKLPGLPTCRWSCHRYLPRALGPGWAHSATEVALAADAVRTAACIGPTRRSGRVYQAQRR